MAHGKHMPVHTIGLTTACQSVAGEVGVHTSHAVEVMFSLVKCFVSVHYAQRTACR